MTNQYRANGKYTSEAKWPILPPEKWEPRDHTKYYPWYVYGKEYGEPETISTYNPLWGNVDSVYTANPTISSYHPSMYTFNIKKEENTIEPYRGFQGSSGTYIVDSYGTITSTPKEIYDPYYQHPHQLHPTYQPHHPYQLQELSQQQLKQRLQSPRPLRQPQVQLRMLADATRKYNKLEFTKNLILLIIVIAVVVVLVLWYLNRQKYINIIKPIRKLSDEAKTLSEKFKRLFRKTESLITSDVKTLPFIG
uniref:Uncharacterized protein n=1 Tax=Mimivirus LCMiAC02 TaxID=2506609 RepID=A0A481Z1H1_9VIRU|nr:MAG: hypothetical protein LCMiAC02_00280 [Mimivirus LCMiAC02]